MANHLDTLRTQLAAIEDKAERAAAVSAVLKGIPDFQAALREIRQADATALHTDQGLSFAEIGAVLDVTRARAKQIVDGQTASGRTLSRKAEAGAQPE
jgi:hypothetical protein